ncbi:hypothetical protein PCANC_21473 [Puccinia coronata f. sp. avenae]|uniref:RING-type domain-containing protein n=1 Tax=Puccinia coronata f. sp. avenae TaxID=200324 RepID=A0A2N5U059_9BASI|nr:hypothetical protein PCANC_21473 [Puccinia coronata f. sp. avenae]
MELNAIPILIVIVLTFAQITSASISQPIQADGKLQRSHSRRALHYNGERNLLEEANRRDRREYPRRRVDWSQFKTLYYAEQRDSQVAADIHPIEGSGREQQIKGDITGGRMKKLGHLITEAIARRGSRRGKELEPVEAARMIGADEASGICLNTYSMEQEQRLPVSVFPTCQHLFHRVCLATWFNSATMNTDLLTHSSFTCPICRRPAPTTTARDLLFIDQAPKSFLRDTIEQFAYKICIQVIISLVVAGILRLTDAWV